MIPSTDLHDPAVQAFVEAVNAGDPQAVGAALRDGATMTDDGRAHEMDAWLNSEVFTTNGRMQVESQSADGRDLVVDYRNDRWGAMRTKWHFEVRDGKI